MGKSSPNLPMLVIDSRHVPYPISWLYSTPFLMT